MTGIPGTVGRPGAPGAFPRAPGRPRAEKPTWLERHALPPLVLRGIAFFLLALLASAHWMALVEPAQMRRALVATIVATAGGAVIALSARFPRLIGVLVRIGVVLVIVLLGLAAIGIRYKLLRISGWETLADRVSGGLAAVGGVGQWPYDGPNHWLRLTTLMAAPLVLTLSAALAFWPQRGRPHEPERGPRSFAALALLVALYGVAVAARPFDQQGLRGLALMACLVAWLWLPRLRGRGVGAALAAIGAAAVVALALGAAVASDQPWIDYRHWSWTLRKEKTIAFDWRHSYGPLEWPRKGTKLLLVRSKEGHYWKAEALERFDGRVWTLSNDGRRAPGVPSLSGGLEQKWVHDVHVTVRGLRSDLVVGPGAILSVDNAPADSIVLSHATFLLEGSLGSGDTYDVRSYTPDPTRRQMRAAPPPEYYMGRETTIELPDDDGFGRFERVSMPLWGVPGSGDPGAAQVLAGSDYARMYALAKRLTADATTQYDAVRAIGSWLEDNFDYSENVPQRRLPLNAFLFRDKRGYCQQFSGAAALMLRMVGVPTRVASGFSPGTLDSKTKEFVVTDLDAHSWVEVWFAGIGWVPFDPTPSAAPAASQAASFAALGGAASAARLDFKDRLPREIGTDAGGSGKLTGSSDGGGTPWGWIAAAIAAAAAALATAVRARRRRVRVLLPACGDAEVDRLVALLARAGLALGPNATLLQIEERLERLAGPEAAGYAQRLRRRRFGPGQEPPPGRAERRRLRHALAEAVGAGPLARLWLAMPQNPRAALRRP